MADDNGKVAVAGEPVEVDEKMVSKSSDKPIRVEDVDGLKFDVDDITAFEVEEFWQAIKDIDVTRISEFMAEYAVKVPEHWGPAEAATFGTLKMSVFKEARGKFMDALAELVKN